MTESLKQRTRLFESDIEDARKSGIPGKPGAPDFCCSQFKFNLFICENMVKLISKVMSGVAMTYYCREIDITRKEYE